MMQRRKSITVKVFLTALVVVLVIAGGLMTVMIYSMNSLTDTVLLDVLQPLAKTAAQSVGGNLHVLAENLFMIRDNSIIASPDYSPAEKQEVLTTAESGVEFEWLGLYDPSGKLLTGGETCPRSISGRGFFSLLLETRNFVIENTSVGNSGLEIVMGIPIIDRDDEASPVSLCLVGSYKYDVLSDVLNNINIGTSGTAFITDDQGRIIAHKNLGKVYSQESVLGSLGTGPEITEVLSLVKQGQTGSAIVRGAGGSQFISYAPIRGTSWSLGIQAPREDFMAAARQALIVCIVITALITVFAGVVFESAFRRVLTSPLRAITKNAEQLAGGEFVNRLPQRLTRRSDEIGQLADAFSRMSDSVQNVIGDIDRLTQSARAGVLDVRADAQGHEGDFHLIVAGINAMLDVIGSYFNAMPAAFALFNEAREPIYLNATMSHTLMRHSKHVQKESLLAMLLSSGSSAEIRSEAERLFTPDAPSGATYYADATLPDNRGGHRNYGLVLRRVTSGMDSISEPGAAASCVMLILRDVTQLTRAKVAAEAASLAKSAFLSNMSHEMRTPMNAIIGMTAIAKSTEDVEKKDYCLGKIEGSSVHLLGVINDILDMSKIEANKLELASDEFSFEKMLQKVVNVISFRVDERRQLFAVHIDQSIPRTLVGDEQRLAQVITNLLSNAVKFTPEKGFIRLDTRFIKEEDQICTLQISVSDTGIGISPEQQARLFSSFEQAESSTSRKYGGTGLGLAISKRIVEMMGGRIWIESELGQGSAFIFTVRLRRGADNTPDPLALSIDRSALRVLAVDDTPEILEYFTEIMKQFGISCDVAPSSEEALALIRQNGPYNIYFVDWKMPGMDGLELTAHIRQNSADKSIVVMISAAEWAGIEGAAKQAGVDKFLPKPLFPSTIAECINECLGEGSADPARELHPKTEAIFRGFRVLLAEDMEINREVVLAMFAPTQLHFDCAENGLEALRMFREHPENYDIIFMDIQMPEMDGYEATRQIRALNTPKAASIPIIAMTANVFREDVERCLASGMNDHVGKPLNYGEVLEKLHQYLHA